MCAESQRPVSQPAVTACRNENLGEVGEILKASPEAAAWSGTALASTFERDSSHFLIGWQREEIAGFIAGRRVADEGEILNLAVKPSYRRYGVGKALVKALMELFAREAVLQVFLEVRESNTAAVAFYQSLGFRQVGRRALYYREPDEAALVLALRTP